MTVALLAVGAGAVGALYGLDRFAGRVVTPPSRRPERDVRELDGAVTEVRIPSRGCSLAGWLVTPDGADRRPLVVVAHGWGANRGTVVDIAEPLVRAGHEALLYDVRGHGASEAAPFVTAREFRDDALAVARWAAQHRPDATRVLLGHSMGAAAAVLAAADGAPVHGLVCIACPASITDVTAEFLRDRGLPGGWIVRALLPFWWRRVGGTFGPLTPERRVREVRLPLLFVQPENDIRVPRHHADRMRSATGLPVHIIRGAEHTDVLRHAETHALVLDFLAVNAARSGPSTRP